MDSCFSSISPISKPLNSSVNIYIDLGVYGEYLRHILHWQLKGASKIRIYFVQVEGYSLIKTGI